MDYKKMLLWHTRNDIFFTFADSYLSNQIFIIGE